MLPRLKPGWPESTVWKIGQGDSTDPVQFWCKNLVTAATDPVKRILGWCEHGLGRSPMLPSSTNIEENDRMPKTMSSTWLHELLHIWTGSIEVRDKFGEWARIQPEFDGTDCWMREKWATKTRQKAITISPSKTKTGRLTAWKRLYGWRGCCRISRLIMLIITHSLPS